MNIRYTIGPDQLWLGDIALVRGEWRDLDETMAAQALLPERVAEYGFEAQSTPRRGKSEE